MSKITLNNVASFQNDSTAVASYAANNATLTTAFDNTLSRDGTSPNQMSASIDMNSNRILNLPAPAQGTEPLRVQDLTAYAVTTANQITVPTSTTIGNVVTWNATNGLTLGVGLSNTGTGNNVLSNSPTLVTPVLGTPTSGVLTNCTGYLISSLSGSITGTGSLVFNTAPTLTNSVLLAGNSTNPHLSILDSGTGFSYIDIAGGTGGSGLRFGQESSAGGNNLIVGSGALDGVFCIRDNKPLQIGANSSVILTVNKTSSWLGIIAGTTAKSQINFAASTAPTSPNDGDFWYDGTNVKIRVGAATKTFTLT